MQTVLAVLLFVLVLQLFSISHKLNEMQRSLYAMFKYWDEQKEYWRQFLEKNKE